jgi:hypothetical protein
LNAFESVTRAAASVLGERGMKFALVGGFAVSVRTDPRFTRDVDLAVAVASDADAENLVRDFLHNDFALVATVEQEATGRLATVRLTRADGGQLDLLFASSGFEPEIANEAEDIEVLPRLVVPVARVGHLLALKLLSTDPQTRPQDAVDLVALRSAASAEDLALAEAAVGQIAVRGFARGRNLRAALRDLVAG